VAKKYGAEVPYIRPSNISDDYTGTNAVVRHAIQWFFEQGETVEYVCCIYATAPFIQSQVIFEAYKQLKDLRVNYCFGVTRFSFPIQRAIKIVKGNKVNMFYPKNFDIRSQDLEEAYHDAGQFYWGNAQAFKDKFPLFSETATPYILPRYLVQDIDTLEDWIRAEAMYKVLQNTGVLS
jgi:pseudaminic acid cytidylyltransferase